MIDTINACSLSATRSLLASASSEGTLRGGSRSPCRASRHARGLRAGEVRVQVQPAPVARAVDAGHAQPPRLARAQAVEHRTGGRAVRAEVAAAAGDAAAGAGEAACGCAACGRLGAAVAGD